MRKKMKSWVWILFLLLTLLPVSTMAVEHEAAADTGFADLFTSTEEEETTGLLPLVAPAITCAPLDEASSSPMVLTVEGDWDSYAWEACAAGQWFPWEGDGASLILSEEDFLAYGFRCTVTQGEQSVTSEVFAYDPAVLEQPVLPVPDSPASTEEEQAEEDVDEEVEVEVEVVEEDADALILAEPTIDCTPLDEATSSNMVLTVEGDWDSYAWEACAAGQWFPWEGDGASLILTKEDFLAYGFRCTVTQGEQSVTSEIFAYDPSVLERPMFMSLLSLNSLSAGSLTDKSEFIRYYQNGSTFDIQGVDKGETFKTTYQNHGYNTAISVNGASRVLVPFQINPVSVGSSLTVNTKLDLAYNGHYVKITYEVTNHGSTAQSFRIGSSADVMIGNNDFAEVTYTSTGLSMDGSPKNSYKFQLVAPDCDTLWYGFFADAYRNIFNDLEDKSTGYNGDSGMAWSWKGTVAPGQTWTRYVLIGAGELPPTPEAPALTNPLPSTLKPGDQVTITGTVNSSGDSPAADTVHVSFNGTEYETNAENGNFSLTITVPEDMPLGDTTLTYWGTTEAGGISEIQRETITIVQEPSIQLTTSSVTVMEEQTLAADWLNAFIQSSSGQVSINPSSISTDLPETYTVLYTARESGFPDATAQLTVTVLPRPAELTDTLVEEGSASFNLSSTLTYTGGLSYQETGFVYGALQNPTLEMKDGQVLVEPTVTVKGGQLTGAIDRSSLAYGVTYYARAYAKATDGSVIYGEQSLPFGVGNPRYGLFSVEYSGTEGNISTFTITRSDGSNGEQTVYYRTVNGSAIGSFEGAYHFNHVLDSVTFAEGETSKTVQVTENSVINLYAGNAATAYANADYRTYFLEIYRVEGGAGIETGIATRNMPMPEGESKSVDRSLFNSYQSSTISGPTQRGDFDDDGLGWTKNEEGTAASSTVDFSSLLPQKAYWETVADELWYQFSFQAKEVNDGYQHIQLVYGSAIDLSFYPYQGSYKSSADDSVLANLNAGQYTAFYAARFTHGGDGINTNYKTYYFPKNSGTNPSTLTEIYKSSAYTEDHFVLATKANGKLNMGNMEITVGFSGSGNGNDKWYSQKETHSFKLSDTKEPELLGIAPMAGGSYMPNDSVTVALVFNEIVDSQNSDLENVSINTNWGVLDYAGGGDTNVLYFTGKVAVDASGELRMTSVNNAEKIKDMAEGGTPSTTPGSYFFNVHLGNEGANAPQVSLSDIENDNGTLTATVSSSVSGVKLEYVWSDSSATPTAGWQLVANGATVSIRQTSGTWHLHARATNGDGVTAHTSKSYTFAEGVIVTPTSLTVTADNTDWAITRPITIAKSPADAEVTVKTPSGTVDSLSGGTYIARENGVYTFTLQSGKETITKTVTVSKVDSAPPVVEIADLTNTYHTEAVTLTVNVSDSGSGIATVLGTWVNGDDSRVTPLSGANGVYTAISPDESGLWTLTVTATDNAGNNGTDMSEAYTINASRPLLTVTKGTESVTGVQYHYSVTANGNTDIIVTLPDGTRTTESTGTFTITEAGEYTVSLTDAAGHFVSQTITVTVPEGETLDGVAPDVRLSIADESWTKGPVTIHVSVYDAGSAGKPLTASWDEGSILLTESTEQPGSFSGSFTVSQNSSYTVTCQDEAQNTGSDTLTITNIDMTAPTITLSGGKASAESLTLTVTATDDQSGSKEVTVIGPDNNPVSVDDNQFTVQQSGDYTVKVTDMVGNEKTQIVTIHSVTFQKDGAFYASHLVAKGGILTDPGAPTKTGYTFAGWYNGETKWDFATATVRENLTLASHWMLTAPTVTLTASADQVTYGESIILTANTSYQAGNGVNLSYTWYKEGNPIAGTADTLTLSTVADTGSYWVKVIASDGSDTTDEALSSPVTVTILPKAYQAGGITIGNILDQNYTGQEITPPLEIKDGDKTLTEGIDYTLAYDNNTDKGVATVTVQFQGNYTGSTTVTFAIVYAELPADITKDTIFAGYTEVSESWSHAEEGVTFTPNPGWTVSTSPDGEYKDRITFDQEGERTETVYVQKDGVIYEVEVSYQLDKTEPEVNITEEPGEDAPWTDKDVTVNFTAHDSVSQVASITVTNPDQAVTTLTPDSSGNYAFTATENGLYTVTVTDKAGNETVETIDISNIDKAEPELIVLGGMESGEELTLAVTGTNAGDSGVTVTVQKDNGAPVKIANGDYLITQPGTYMFTATTGAGKEITVTKIVHSITFDGENAQLVVNEGKITAPQDPIQAGYTFACWMQGQTPWDFATPVTDHINLTSQWTLNPPTVTVTSETSSVTYGTDITLTAKASHAASGVTYAYQWYKGQNKLEGEIGDTLIRRDVADTGSYWVLVTIQDKAGLTAEKSSDSVTVTITKAVPDYTLPTGLIATYGHRLNSVQLPEGWAWDNPNDLVGNAGEQSHAATFTPTDTDNYNTVQESLTIMVNKAILTPSVGTVADKIYDGNASTTGTITLLGAVGTDAPTATGAFTFVDPNAESDKRVNVENITLDPAWTANYTLSVTSLTNQVSTGSINQRPVKLTWDYTEPFSYDKTAKTVKAMVDNKVENDTFTLTYSGNTGTDAQTYLATVIDLGNANYTLAGGEGLSMEWEILPAVISFTVADNTHTYDGTGKMAQVTQADEQIVIPASGYTVTYSGAAYQTNAGTYDILVTITDDNFSFAGMEKSAKVGELLIRKKPVLGTWQNLNQVYGSKETVSILLSGLVAGDKVTAVIRGGGTDAGSYLLTASLDNYDITPSTAALVIQQKPVVVTVTNNAVMPGEKPEINVGDLTEGVDYTVTYRDKAGNPVVNPTEPGTYQVWVAFPADGNYRHADGSSEAQVGTFTIAETELTQYLVGFDGNGATQGSMASLELVGGSILTLPQCSYTKAGSQFTGWLYNGKLYQPGDRVTTAYRHMTFTAQWQETIGSISGLVQQNEQPVEGAVVSLWLGAAQVAETQTDGNGQYAFGDLLPGIYNLVASYGQKTVTSMVEIAGSHVTKDFTLPQYLTNSVLEVSPGSPDIVVGNLDAVFDDTDGEEYTPADAAMVEQGGKVDIRFTVEEKQESEVGAATVKDLQSVSGGNLSLFLDVSLTKTVTVGETISTTEIPQTSTLLTIGLPLPAELQGKHGYTVSRSQEGKLQALTTTGNELGEYFEVNADKTVLILHVKTFSAYYAVGYRNASSDSTYTPVREESDNGSFSLSPSRPSSGQTVTITPKPEAGYVVDEVTVIDRNGDPVSVEKKADGTYIFTQPSGSVTITVTFRPGAIFSACPKDETCPLAAFSDLVLTAWYHDGVHYCLDEGLMEGYTNGIFGPNDTLTRSQLVQILWNLEGRPAASGSSSFIDVAETAWYAEAVTWASENGIVTGYSNETFGPGNAITRQQLAAILYRYAMYREDDVSIGEDANILSYTDAQEIDQYAIPAMEWACDVGIIEGYAGALDPMGTATRAQAATMLMRFASLE